MKKYLIIIASLLLSGCNNGDDIADAYGNFEAVEVVVSAETPGKILIFDLTEGTDIRRGDDIAVIDTTLFILQRDEIISARHAVGTKIKTIESQNGVIQQQIDNLNVDIARVEKLLKSDAATQKQYDDLKGQVAVLQKQIDANNTQRESVAAEMAAHDSKMALLKEQIARCYIKSPVDGTIITKYAEAGELAVTGKPLLKLADMTSMKIKAYVSGSQLGKIRIGQECVVKVDDIGGGLRTYKGKVCYVSEKSEFTPKIIQTKEERVTLVYAVTIDVKNDGALKAGMPAEVTF